MEAVKFIKEWARMCSSVSCCEKCNMKEKKDVLKPCGNIVKERPEEAVSIVEKWSAEHPTKTRQSEFLKMFPNADILNGIIRICLKKIDQNSVTSEECSEAMCGDCRKKTLACGGEMMRHVKVWNKWRKNSLNGEWYKFLVLLGFCKSSTFEIFKNFYSLDHFDKTDKKGGIE